MTLPTIHIEMLLGALRVYEQGKSYAKRSDYKAMMLCLPHYSDDKGVIIEGALGDLDNDTNILIGLKLIEHGYQRLYFKVPQGGAATRHVQLVETIDGFDYYMTDLLQTRDKLLGKSS